MLKVSDGILITGILAVITQLAVVQTDITHIKDGLKSVAVRMSKLEDSMLTSKDAEQLIALRDAKFEAVNARIDSTENKIDTIRQKLDE